MKLTTTKRKAGMTLLELTVVILVLLSLISILFIGARAWKRGSDRAGCILNMRNTQQAVRSYANMNNLNPGDTVTGWKVKVVGTGLFMEKDPTCPGSGTYAWAADTTIPPIGTLAITCSLSADPDNHQPADSSGW
jgi:type II secretory pathway pseudopilin PulG